MFNHSLVFVHPRYRADNLARGCQHIGFLAENIEIMWGFRKAVLHLTAGCLSAVAYWTP